MAQAWDGNSIRKAFLDFFQQHDHQIVPSAPMVIKDDPTLMFTNAGMNQFKEYILGVRPAPWPRACDAQKCLRVSGKQNDLEEVGHDTYHHTMFEMLGNWSFGNYFKQEVIGWAWELLTKVYGIDPSKLYATVFEGSTQDGIPRDQEALEYWKQYLKTTSCSARSKTTSGKWATRAPAAPARKSTSTSVTPKRKKTSPVPAW